MSVGASPSGLSYQARARIADNLLIARRMAGLSQVALEELAIVSSGRISEIENGKVVGGLDTYLRLAGAVGLSLDEILAGVRWSPGSVESEYETRYLVALEVGKAPCVDSSYPRLNGWEERQRIAGASAGEVPR